MQRREFLKSIGALAAMAGIGGGAAAAISARAEAPKALRYVVDVYGFKVHTRHRSAGFGPVSRVEVEAAEAVLPGHTVVSNGDGRIRRARKGDTPIGRVVALAA